MYGTQTLITTFSPEQLTELLRGVVRAEVRSELAHFVPAAPKAVALPDYPSRRQTRDVLGVTYTTLTNWSKPTKERAAILVPFKVGTRIRYRREEVLALLQESERLRRGETKRS